MTTQGSPRITIRGIYYDIEGVGVLPRVSSRLELICPKPGLVGWAMNLVAENVRQTIAAWQRENGGSVTIDANRLEALVADAKRQPRRAKDQAADRGTRAHATIKAYLANPKAPVEKDCEYAILNFDSWFGESGLSVLHTERTVWDAEAGYYAGTVDLIAQGPDGLWVIDFKTGKALYPEHWLQVAAYAHAVEACGLGEVARTALVRLEKDIEGFEAVTRTDWPLDYQAFAHGLVLAAWQERTERERKETNRAK